MNQENNSDELLADLIAFMAWCLSQYSNDEWGPAEECEQTHHFQPNWSPLRALQNNLHHFIGNRESDQASAVAALMVYVIDKVFSDLCTDTPWDQRGIINGARKHALDAVLKFLDETKASLEMTGNSSDANLWKAFRDFENRYNGILSYVDNEDLATINRETASIRSH